MPVDDRVARSVALEQAYVHDVYEQFYDNPKSKPWPKVKTFLDHLEPGSIVCDVGCGNGKYLNVNSSICTIGGDKSTRMTAISREKRNEVVTLDNLHLPYRDESLDAVLSIAVIHHLATTERRINAIKELARVLRIGGRLIISVWAMEQSQRKFESQDVLVPWHRLQHLSTLSFDQTSTANTSEDDCLPPYNAYTQSDSESNTSNRSKTTIKKRGKNRNKGRSIDPNRPTSPSNSSLSSPNETCYSFVRRAIQKLAGGKRIGGHKPWFLESWTNCTTRNTPKPQPTCDCCDCLESIDDLPIELRRIDDDDFSGQRRQTFPSSQLVTELSNLKSRSLTNIKTVDNAEPSTSKAQDNVPDIAPTPALQSNLNKPKLIKQKKSVCDEDADEALDQPTEMFNVERNLPDFRTILSSHRKSVLKQRSLNEELMSTDRLQEKERVRQNIHKQQSLNEDLFYSHNLESFFSISTSKRFQLIKTGFTNKLKNSTTSIEKVTSQSLKNGFARMFKNWKSTETSPTIPEDESVDTKSTTDDKKELLTNEERERRHSKEDGSDSSKDSSLQSDTSVDSEDSFASVIFVPKSNPMSPTLLSPGPTSPRLKASSVPNSPRIKQSSCPTSPRIKNMPLTVCPLQKQLSSPKPTTTIETPPEPIESKAKPVDSFTTKMLAQKYTVQQIPKFKGKTAISPKVLETSPSKIEEVKKCDAPKPHKGKRKEEFPLVRHSSVATNGKVEPTVKPIPRLLSLELFNPETDDKDSDSSGVSSPDSIESIVSVKSERKTSETKFVFPSPLPESQHKQFIKAAANVASTLDEAVGKVITTTAKNKRKFKRHDLGLESDSDLKPLLTDTTIDDNLKEFTDKLSEKLLQQIDNYQEKTKRELSNTSLENVEESYFYRLSNELSDLSKLSEEIKKQNEYLAKLSISDRMYTKCIQCNRIECVCAKRAALKATSSKSGSSNSETSTNKGKSCVKKSLTNENIPDQSAKSSKEEKCEKMGSSFDSCDSEKGSSTSSMLSSAATSINFGPSMESADFSSESHKSSKYTDNGGSTASLASFSEQKSITSTSISTADSKRKKNSSFYSDISQDSLPSDVGGEITYHRFYHVFKKGELDQLIDEYVENLHITNSYYDHASWCIIAEKVQVWTI